MAFLGKAKKEDLKILAEELGEKVLPEYKVVDLKRIIIDSKEYEENFVMELLNTIKNERIEKEALEARKMDFELEKLRIEIASKNAEATVSLGQGDENMRSRYELRKLMQKFDPKEGDISLYLTLFERQASRAHVKETDWVSHLLSLLPYEIAQLIAREPTDKAEDYKHVKDLLLKRFKLSPEKFRQKFFHHQKSHDKTWKDFSFEIESYFEEWITGLKVATFEQLKNLLISDQIKSRVSSEVKRHFIDDWTKIVVPSDLTDRLDEYENMRENDRRYLSCSKLKENVRHGNWANKSSEQGVCGFNRSTPGPSNFKQRRPNQQHPSYRSDNTYNPQKSQIRKEIPVNTKPKFISKPKCFVCGEETHFARACPSHKDQHTKSKVEKSPGGLIQTTTTSQENDVGLLSARITVPMSPLAETNVVEFDKLNRVEIKCGKLSFQGVVDSGAQVSVIRSDLIPDDCDDGEGKIKIISAFGEAETATLRVVPMKINDGYHDEVPITCAVSKKLVSDMLICSTAYQALSENIKLSETREDMRDNTVQEVTGEIYSENRKSFIKLQREDESLKNLWTLAENDQNSYTLEGELLLHSEVICGERVKQVVLPLCKRDYVLKIAHDVPLAGHLGEQKTKQRIKYSFYWPTIKSDVKKYCESCRQCQLRRTVTYRDRIPIQPIVRPENPFEIWSVDCIGPLEPPSRRGHKFIICAVDLCTRWAEAVPVRNIQAKTTCDVLMKIFTQTGFPKKICTDQGTNFTSQLTKAFLDVLGIAPRFSTPGHPESMGAVERWNRTLKEMLNKNIQDHNRDWDLHLPYLLFAYREVPHSTTGISPYQMVYGRLPRGPLTWIKDFWTGKRDIPITASRTIESYLDDLQDKLRSSHAIANDNANKNQSDYVRRYNMRSREKTFEVGDQVLVLVPSSSHKLLNTWQGPVTIVELTRPHSALVRMENGSTREFHVNKLRPYVSRVQQIGLIFEQDNDFGNIHYAPTDQNEKTQEDIRWYIQNCRRRLDEKQCHELNNILCKFADVFSNNPGSAKVDGHSVRIIPGSTPKKLRPYRIPVILQEEVDRQIDQLLKLELIEPSDSDWAHPVVCVAKRNGNVRLCVDFRLLNKFTVPDAYPMKHATELLYEIGKAQYITVLDLTKGYWQIPMREEDKHFTAFVTHSGHYQWKVLPFGMKNAGSTFQKVMDKVLSPHKKYCRSYIDDLAIFSEDWKEHLKHITEVFKTLRTVGLTVNLEKCDFGKREVKFLGHIIGSGKHSPDPEKVEAMKKMPRPTTKKEVRGILGLANYYRDYIPDFATLVLPLTNLTRKRVPVNIPWGDEEETAFQNLKQKLSDIPSLFTPVLNKPFQLYTDASATAIGACLSQTDDQGKEHPIAFFSKKLTPCQSRWSTIEREAYSVLAALQKFDTWIFGAEVQVVSDHNPLTYLAQSQPHGAKLVRWALALQRYNVNISYRKGRQHGNADALSRLPSDSATG